MTSPTIWVYMPYTNQDIAAVEFSVHDRNETQTLYRSSIPLADMPGVMSITVPIALEMENVYQWKLMINCEPTTSEYSDFALEGWMMRTTPDPRWEWDGVWYDALNDVATRRRTDPQNTAAYAAWVRLLEQVGLADLASGDFVSARSVSN